MDLFSISSSAGDGLDFLLMGKISSDPIEKRFGRYRQMSGANYYVSVRQIMQSEKIIRLKALITFSNLSLSEIKIMFSGSSESIEKSAKADAVTLTGMMSVEGFTEFKNVVKALGVPFANDKAAMASFQKMDKAGNGKITENDFIAWWKSSSFRDSLKTTLARRYSLTNVKLGDGPGSRGAAFG